MFDTRGQVMKEGEAAFLCLTHPLVIVSSSVWGVSLGGMVISVNETSFVF